MRDDDENNVSADTPTRPSSSDGFKDTRPARRPPTRSYAHTAPLCRGVCVCAEVCVCGVCVREAPFRPPKTQTPASKFKLFVRIHGLFKLACCGCTRDSLFRDGCGYCYYDYYCCCYVSTLFYDFNRDELIVRLSNWARRPSPRMLSTARKQFVAGNLVPIGVFIDCSCKRMPQQLGIVFNAHLMASTLDCRIRISIKHLGTMYQ